jgi:hypothetical protein
MAPAQTDPNAALQVSSQPPSSERCDHHLSSRSMRPQMHRLKTDGILGQDPSSDTWNFQDGKRPLYANVQSSNIARGDEGT